MKRSTNVILGVPVDSLTMAEALERIFQLLESYPSDRKPRLVCTANMALIVDTLSWSPGHVRHPELLSIIRRADLVTADGMPVVWASRQLGPALKERVTGADLVSRLAGEAALRGKSLYFLGGEPGTAEKAAAVLREECPGLLVAGYDSPLVHLDGQRLAEVPEADGAIVEKINRASPDLLLIALGNPGQELFFERNRHRLKVPVTIGIGDTSGFTAGSAPRAPVRMRANGLAWLSRLIRDPGRLWKLSLQLKFWFQVWPSIVLYQYTRRVAPHPYLKKCKSKVSYKYMTRGKEQVLLLTLPGTVDAEAVPRLAALIPGRPSTHLILDVSDVGFIDSAGLGLLLGVVNLWGMSRHEVLITGATPYAEKVLIRNRMHDLFAGRVCPTLDDAFGYLDAHAGKDAFSMDIMEHASSSTIAFSGTLKPSVISPGEIRVLASRVKGMRCTMDLSGLDSISTSGIILLLRIRKALESLGKECISAGVRGDVARMLKVTGTDRLL